MPRFLSKSFFVFIRRLLNVRRTSHTRNLLILLVLAIKYVVHCSVVTNVCKLFQSN